MGSVIEIHKFQFLLQKGGGGTIIQPRGAVRAICGHAFHSDCIAREVLSAHVSFFMCPAEDCGVPHCISTDVLRDRVWSYNHPTLDKLFFFLKNSGIFSWKAIPTVGLLAWRVGGKVASVSVLTTAITAFFVDYEVSFDRVEWNECYLFIMHVAFLCFFVVDKAHPYVTNLFLKQFLIEGVLVASFGRHFFMHARWSDNTRANRMHAWSVLPTAVAMARAHFRPDITVAKMGKLSLLLFLFYTVNEQFLFDRLSGKSLLPKVFSTFCIATVVSTVAAVALELFGVVE